MSNEPKDEGQPSAPKNKREKRVIAKHLAVARNVARGATLQEAGEAVGYPAESARQSAWRAMETIKRKAPEVFDKRGLTLDSLADDVHRLRRAKETKFFSDKGVVIEEREVEALDIQLKAVDMGLRVHGAYERNEDGRNPAGNSITSNTICVVTSDPETATSLVKLFAPRGTPNIVLDVAPEVDQNLG